LGNKSLLDKTIGQRVTPIPAKRTLADPDTRRRLSALVLTDPDHKQHPIDFLGRMTGRN
jgi:hypothetical protein